MLLDYYKILGLSESATLTEIKSAYRKLAKKFHPDVVGNNKEKLVYFDIIKEAYETLTNAKLRYAYYEKRWLLKSQGQHFENYQPITAVRILKNLIKIEQDAYFMVVSSNAEELVAQKISDTLRPQNMEILLQQNEDTLHHQIALLLVKLIPQVPIIYLPKLFEKINALQFSQKNQLLLQFQKEQNKYERQLFWQKKMWVVILLIICILLCVIKFL